MKITSAAIINDCHDSDANARQSLRVSGLFGVSPTFIPLKNYSEIEAAGILVDALDALEDSHGLVLVNSAPRHGKAKKWPNGTPFGYFKYKNSFVVTTVDGLTLSLVNKLGLVSDYKLFDMPSTLDKAVVLGLLPESTAKRIKQTQFRSYEFSPRLAKWIVDGHDLPFENYDLEQIEDIGNKIWFIDNFGNCKTTLFAEDIEFEVGKIYKTNFGEVEAFGRLKDVPNAGKGIVIGSSGIDNKRFVEFVAQGKRADEIFGISLGDELEIS